MLTQCNTTSALNLDRVLCWASNNASINSTQDNETTTDVTEDTNEDMVVWVPYLGLVLFLGSVIVLSVSFYSRYTRALQRRQSHKDYKERNIDLKRTRLHCIMHMAPKPSQEDYFALENEEATNSKRQNNGTGYPYYSYNPNSALRLSSSLHSVRDFAASDPDLPSYEQSSRRVSIHALHPSQLPQHLLRRADFPQKTRPRYRERQGLYSQCHHCQCCCHRHPDRWNTQPAQMDTSVEKEDKEVLTNALNARRRCLSSMHKKRNLSLAKSLKRDKKAFHNDIEPKPLKQKGAKLTRSEKKKQSLEIKHSDFQPESSEARPFPSTGGQDTTTGAGEYTHSAQSRHQDSIAYTSGEKSESTVEDIYISPQTKESDSPPSTLSSPGSSRSQEDISALPPDRGKKRISLPRQTTSRDKTASVLESGSTHLTGFTNYAFDQGPSDVDEIICPSDNTKLVSSVHKNCSESRPESQEQHFQRTRTSFPIFTPVPTIHSSEELIAEDMASTNSNLLHDRNENHESSSHGDRKTTGELTCNCSDFSVGKEASRRQVEGGGWVEDSARSKDKCATKRDSQMFSSAKNTSYFSKPMDSNAGNTEQIYCIADHATFTKGDERTMEV
ncbi:uncharacterized protein LOC101851899 [Aplysia californica]|uniref:Uncharacterized protein LOC101851899 n=1 Tax=Aplysia californica TaxID=6500 RepID=A0ABM0K7A1_APLCA|nr:uncharacterized protein LOC101851899 [Aplysia californica]XP_005110428.1 uncharacterized protein LOC101851899 [Aplysia californica]